ncbi:AraC family transcriptional regulator [Bradyrhizobium sp. LHD-71]|uniref:AraC family transcriptional regulator n=1 Tax=Bradyrhizobium sp. LHD-71 TaxID=3072141 RepID=UPI00280D1AC4|nr:AraC family transcriptional regulator [Bradyrhizobium sp. LHD-71]MDQ8729961.1 AraC family transcriptional regulator [Bradyrhizobium sp. LHD-71]
MNKVKERIDYQARLNRVIGFIHDHLDEEIDLNRLADVACLSPYHWHRIYHAMHGETIAATVRRLRLHRAAGLLANTVMPIEMVAEKSGYASTAAFTRAFSLDYGMPPAQYRREGGHAKFLAQSGAGDGAAFDVTIKTIPSLRLAAIYHLGSYMQIGKAFEQLYGWFAVRGLLGTATRSIGVYYDDPFSVDEDALRSRAGLVVDPGFAVQAPLIETMIPGGRHAVLRHKGPYATMRAAYQWLYGTWLTQHDEEPADAPVFEEYFNNPRDTAPADLLTDICLPLR